MKKLIFSCVFGLLLLIPTVSAGLISIDQGEDTAYLVLNPETQAEISAFRVQLLYPETVMITEVAFFAPYTGAYNIQNDNGTTLISGFTGGKASVSRLVMINFTGSGSIGVCVKKIIDYNLNVIETDNVDEEDDRSVPSIPEYAPSPGYISPGSTTTDSDGEVSNIIPVSHNNQLMSNLSDADNKDPSGASEALNQASTQESLASNGFTNSGADGVAQQNTSSVANSEQGSPTNAVPLSLFSSLMAIATSIAINIHGRR